jgi:hypothetical protein
MSLNYDPYYPCTVCGTDPIDHLDGERCMFVPGGTLKVVGQCPWCDMKGECAAKAVPQDNQIIMTCHCGRNAVTYLRQRLAAEPVAHQIG